MRLPSPFSSAKRWPRAKFSGSGSKQKTRADGRLGRDEPVVEEVGADIEHDACRPGEFVEQADSVRLESSKTLPVEVLQHLRPANLGEPQGLSAGKGHRELAVGGDARLQLGLHGAGGNPVHAAGKCGSDAHRARRLPAAPGVCL